MIPMKIEGFSTSNSSRKVRNIHLKGQSDKQTARLDPDTQVVGNSLLRIVLECFMFWPIMFEEEIELSLVFEQLSEQQVTFPKDINYFKAFYKTL